MVPEPAKKSRTVEVFVDPNKHRSIIKSIGLGLLNDFSRLSDFNCAVPFPLLY